MLDGGTRLMEKHRREVFRKLDGKAFGGLFGIVRTYLLSLFVEILFSFVSAVKITEGAAKLPCKSIWQFLVRRRDRKQKKDKSVCSLPSFIVSSCPRVTSQNTFPSRNQRLFRSFFFLGCFFPSFFLHRPQKKKRSALLFR